MSSTGSFSGDEQSFEPPSQEERLESLGSSIGYRGERLLGRLSSGQRVLCRVLRHDLDGYLVVILINGAPGFLPTSAKLELGQEVFSNITRSYRGRIWLSEEFTEKAVPQKLSSRDYKPKRAVDLFPSPLERSTERTLLSGEFRLDELIAEIIRQAFTGCLQISSQRRRSRAGILLADGRAVGALYNRKYAADILPTEQSLRLALVELEMPGTDVRMYELPEHIVLPMSSLFLGYPIHRKDTMDTSGFLHFILEWFRNKAQTACIVIQLPATASTCLGFILRGTYTGAFYVEDNRFSEEPGFLQNLIEYDSHASIEVSILPPDMISSTAPFGLSLNDFRPRSV